MNLRKYAHFLLLATIVVSFFACGDKDDDPVDTTDWTDAEYTNKWIYDKMKRVYLWNDKMPASPNYQQEPNNFFASILYNFGSASGDLFSWMEEDQSKTKTKTLFLDDNLGFDCIPYPYFVSKDDEDNASLGFFVTYVFDGSDAAEKGIKRGQVIYKVNGEKVTFDNYEDILKGSSYFDLELYDIDGIKKKAGINATSKVHSPVFISRVIEAYDKKIAYLMYNNFARNADDSDNNFEFDIDLIESIKELKDEGFDDFVLDLRYNPGGYLISALNLASAFVSGNETGEIFLKEEYNTYFRDSLVTKYGAESLNSYFRDKVYGTNVDIPKLGLSRLYVIATGYSASASESVMHGLKPYMTVYHVGEQTVGKDKFSMTLQAKDNERIKWQWQPIIGRLKDKNGKGDYTSGLSPNYEVSEIEEGYNMVTAYASDGYGGVIKMDLPIMEPWKGGFGELGDETEPMLAEAIAKITNTTRPKTVKASESLKLMPKTVRMVKPDESRYRTIIDAKDFDELKKQ